MTLNVRVMKEAGYEEALYGLSLSFKDRNIPVSEWWTEEKLERMSRLVVKLKDRGGGHNKFLESIVVWLDVEAPRYWWSEFDTYRVGMTKQSESTMHTLSKRDLTLADLDDNIIDREGIEQYLASFNSMRKFSSIASLKAMLPDGYLQRRQVCTNYMCLRNILNQRHNHRLKLWKSFQEQVLEQTEHPELLVTEEK